MNIIIINLYVVNLYKKINKNNLALRLIYKKDYLLHVKTVTEQTQHTPSLRTVRQHFF